MEKRRNKVKTKRAAKTMCLAWLDVIGTKKGRQEARSSLNPAPHLKKKKKS